MLSLVFTVPQTHDMLSELFSPNKPKNTSDIVVLIILSIHVLALVLLPKDLRVPVHMGVFLFWRASYNGLIGLLLHMQSHHLRLVNWAKNSGIFEHPSTGKCKYPWVYELLKREFETKIPKDYDFDKAPIEYNTWLLFRRLVDLILTCDFTAYSLFAIACTSRPVGESTIVLVSRWVAGIMLVLFNLWVKVDAHRVVKDYAWYWGDFFFLVDQELTFDGVFEMAPHPMYSVGYAGFYGVSLMAASYKVLLISIVAHTCQMAFLAFVENPHIDKTYNAPPPRETIEQQEVRQQVGVAGVDSPTLREDDLFLPTAQPSSMHKMLGFGKTDLFRVTDLSVVLLQVYLWAAGVLAPRTPVYQALFVANAIFWRLWYCVGVGYILDKQSREKYWTRHFVKHGEGIEEAWRQWKGFYHLSMTMFYGSFLVAAWRMYNVPPDWEYKMALLRHIVGLALVALQCWTVSSIFDSLGEFGWFYGDFFFDPAPNLTYGGIYRFLNNPERILGLAGVWGLALITWSRAIFITALISHLLTLSFIYFVERPHMKRLYGERLRQDSGLSKSIKRSLPQPIREFGGSVDRVIDQTVDFVEEFIDNAKPRVAAGVGSIKGSTAKFRSYPSRIALTKLAPNLTGYDLDDYSIEIEGTPLPSGMVKGSFSGREGENARSPAERRSDFRTLVFEYGAPINVKWTAPLHHSRRDWIGLYMVVDNASRLVTRVASQGRWVATNRGIYDSIRADQGIFSSDRLVSVSKDQQQQDENEEGKHDYLSGDMVFAGDKLWWTPGVFEFRYHHDGKHNVMAISLPFEVRIPEFVDDVEQYHEKADAIQHTVGDEVSVPPLSERDTAPTGGLRTAVERALLPVVRNCFDRDPDIAPSSVDEAFGSLVERDGKYARRVVFAVHEMCVFFPRLLLPP